MNKYERYVVVGSRKLTEHGYSTKVHNALQYAIDCADHYTMKGRVFGESSDGSRTLVYTHKEDNPKEKEE